MKPASFGLGRCVYCGEYIDQVILENRQHQKLNRERSGGKIEGLYIDPQTPHLLNERFRAKCTISFDNRYLQC